MPKIVPLTRAEVVELGGATWVKTLSIPTLQEMTTASKLIYNFTWLPHGFGYRIKR